MKPYAVLVIIGDKKSSKEFDTKEELQAFLKKAEGLKQKAPHLEIKIIRNGLTPKEEEKDPREDSLCWEPLYRNGIRVKDANGKPMFKCVEVPKKGKKVLYCPYCLAYKDKVAVDLGYGLVVDGCKDCGITVNDFYMKTANGLWI